jgi:hypothetical protein
MFRGWHISKTRKRAWKLKPTPFNFSAWFPEKNYNGITKGLEAHVPTSIPKPGIPDRQQPL